jgi:hypothetical protein
VSDGNPHIAQDGDHNLVIGQMLGGTVNFTPPVQKPTGTPSNLSRSGVVEFVGRSQKLKKLHAQLQQNDRLAITAIAGMGDIGKTELALQYAIAQFGQGQYPAGLCWLRARDQEIATQIVTFAQAHLGLNPPDQLEIEAQVRYC